MISICSINDSQFIKKFIKFSSQQYDDKLVNFNTGYSVLDLFNNSNSDCQRDRLKSKIFKRIRQSVRVGLMEQEVMYLECGGEDVMEWLQMVSQGRCFQMAHKVVNKQAPEDNILWFCAESFSTLQAYLANQIQKNVIKHYLKRDTISNQKLVQFTQYVSKKHPQYAFLMKLSIQEVSRMTILQKQQYVAIIKGYQMLYYEDVRRSFIESLESIQNSKEMKKKKKQKRKLYKKKQNDTVMEKMENNQDQILNEINQEDKCTQINNIIGVAENNEEKQKDHSQEQIKQVLLLNDTVLQFKPQQQTQKQQQPQETIPVNTNNNKQQQPINSPPLVPQKINNHHQKQSPVQQQQTASFLPSQQTVSLQTTTKSKNIVYYRQRQRSPYSKSNIVDNQCSKSQLSGEIYETYTECLREDIYQDQKQQHDQLFQIDAHPLEVDHNQAKMAKCNNSNNKNNADNKQANDIQEQTDRLKKRRKRKNNTNTLNNNNNTQSSLNNQLSTKIKSHCHKSFNTNLTHFIDHLSIQTNNLYQSKIVVFQRIRYFIKAFYPQSEIMLFGSNSIGLSLATSDVDVMVLNIHCSRREEVREILAQIAIEINVMAWVVSCSTYLSAKTPLVKLQIDPLISYYETKRKSDYCIYHPQLHEYLDIKDRKKAKNISLDLTISLQPTPYSPSTELMRSYLNTNPLLQRIILIIKYILTTKAYNKNFSGGLGSYCLFIMIAAYFQENPQCMKKDQGELLLDVLKFYSQEFQNLVTSITLRDNASCFISLEESLTMANFSQNILSNPLRIIDPLTQKLTSSSCSQYHLIKLEFRRIRTQILLHLESIHNEVQPNFTQKSAKTQGLDKNIEKIVHKSEAKRKGWLKKIIQGKNQTR